MHIVVVVCIPPIEPSNWWTRIDVFTVSGPFSLFFIVVLCVQFFFCLWCIPWCLLFIIGVFCLCPRTVLSNLFCRFPPCVFYVSFCLFPSFGSFSFLLPWWVAPAPHLPVLHCLFKLPCHSLSLLACCWLCQSHMLFFIFHMKLWGLFGFVLTSFSIFSACSPSLSLNTVLLLFFFCQKPHFFSGRQNLPPPSFLVLVLVTKLICFSFDY